MNIARIATAAEHAAEDEHEERPPWADGLPAALGPADAYEARERLRHRIEVLQQRSYKLRDHLHGDDRELYRKVESNLNRFNAHTLTPEQLSETEAVIEKLERAAEPSLAAARAKARLEHVRRFDFPITDADVTAIATRTLTETKAYTCARKWLTDRPVPVLVLSGPPGTGKTLAAAACCAAYRPDEGHRDREALYVRAPVLVRLSLASFGEEFEKRDRIITNRGLIAIDDVGTGEGTDRLGESMCAVLTEAIDTRRSDDKLTLITTNLSRADFEKRYPDPRLHSRMAQSAMWVTVDGADMRRKKATP